METIEDIVADLRQQNLGMPDDMECVSPLVCDMLRLADRIEKANKSLEAEKSRIIADRNELVELNRKCCDENERLKAALQPVLECEYKAYHDGTGVWIDSPGRAVREDQSIWKEGEK